MKRLLNALVLTAVSAACLCAQNGITPYTYIATTGNVVLAGATTAATLQQPAANAQYVSFPSNNTGGVSQNGATVYCSVACTATVIRNASAATTTAGTVNSINPTEPPAVVNFFTSSNYSGGTTLEVFNIAATTTLSIDLGGFYLLPSGTTSNITIAINSITGTANITFYLIERH